MAEFIEREAAVQCSRDVARDFENDGEDDASNGAYTVGDWLAAIPAADVRPVVRGKWVDHPRWKWIYAECSECEVVSDVKSNFCPNCGADMRYTNDEKA